MKLNFREKELGPDFAQDKLKEFKKLIEAGVSFVAMSMPGVGASYFLKYLACQDWAYFVHVDLYSLPTLNQHEFYRMFLKDLGGNPGPKTDEQVFLETKALLKKLADTHEKIVIIFSRFDQLKSDFDANFLSNLQALTTIQPDKIVLIFTSIKPLDEIAPDAITGGNMTFYSKYLYFKPYTAIDLKKLLKLEGNLSLKNLDKLIELSGGHNQLLHILLNSQKQQNLLLDRFVKMQMKELVDYLDYGQRKQIQKMALGKPINEPDDYLLGVGMVKKTDSEQSTSEVKKMQLHLGGVKFELFTPLLAEYIKQNMPMKLPVKEAKLFRLLRQNMGKTVSKDDLFKAVWQENEEASDWALDALIYRLRNHPFIKSQGYIIESHKKVGYTLIQT